MITISDLAGKTYYFKLFASTQSGQGKPTKPVRLDPGIPYTDRTGKVILRFTLTLNVLKLLLV